MYKYILLGDICFDWSGGEYSNEYVTDIYLGIGTFADEDKARDAAENLMIEYCKYDYSIRKYDSSFHVKLVTI